MAEVTSEAIIQFDVNSGLDGTPSQSKSPNDDINKAMQKQFEALEKQMRLVEALSTGKYTNPSTGETTTNKQLIKILAELSGINPDKNNSSNSATGFKNRSAFFANNIETDWTNLQKSTKDTSMQMDRLGASFGVAAGAFISAAVAINKSTIGASSYEYENRLAEGKSSAYTSLGMGIGGVAGGALGSLFGPAGTAAGAYFGGQLGSELGSYLGKETTVSAQANTQLRSLSNLSGGYFQDYSSLTKTLGTEQRAQDFINISKNVFANTSGMAGLTGQAGIDFTKTFGNKFSNTLTDSEQATTANTLAALLSHSGLGKDTATTAKAVSKLADMATETGVMPNVLASAALQYQGATGSRDYNEALRFANLQATQGGTIAGMSQAAQMSGAQSTIQSELLLNLVGLSLDDIKNGDSSKIAKKIGAPTTGKRKKDGDIDANLNQYIFEQAGFAYKPYYNSAKGGTAQIDGKASVDSMDNVGQMMVNATNVYLTGNIKESQFENAPVQRTPPTEEKKPKAPIATFRNPSFKMDDMVPPIMSLKSDSAIRKMAH